MSEQQQKKKSSCMYLRQMETIVYLEFRKLLDVFIVSYSATPLFQHSVWQQRRVEMGNLDNFTLLFCRGRLRNEQSFKTHALRYCSAHYLDL